MAIIRQLKGLSAISGQLRAIMEPLERPMKRLREAVMIGLPAWDPPPPRPPAPPDHETVARVQEVIGMGTLEERKALDRVTETWKKTRQGQPREPARFPGRQEGHPPTPEKEPPREAR